MSGEICRRCDGKQHRCVTPDPSYKEQGAGEVRRAKTALRVDGMGERKEKNGAPGNTSVGIIIILSFPCRHHHIDTIPLCYRPIMQTLS